MLIFSESEAWDSDWCVPAHDTAYLWGFDVCQISMDCRFDGHITSFLHGAHVLCNGKSITDLVSQINCS